MKNHLENHDIKEMPAISKAVIIGMGALGMIFADRIQETCGEDHVCFLVDKERARRYQGKDITINGKPKTFRIVCPEELDEPAELLIIATKYRGLESAIELAKPVVSGKTTIISLLNGIISEEIIARTYPPEQIIDCIAIGMDAVRDGFTLTYQNMGRLQIGTAERFGRGSRQRLEALEAFFRKAGVPHEVCDDITRAMWNKFMINVGSNQTCMVYDVTYGGSMEPGEAFDDMCGAMHEVIDLAKAEGIGLTEADFEKDIALLASLNPDGFPSMRQDALAKRPSEVELFAGTVIRLSEKHGLPAEVNRKYYRKVKEIEKEYPR